MRLWGHLPWSAVLPPALSFCENAVSHFVPTLDQKPSHLVTVGQGTNSPVSVQRINTIANLVVGREIMRLFNRTVQEAFGEYKQTAHGRKAERNP